MRVNSMADPFGSSLSKNGWKGYVFLYIPEGARLTIRPEITKEEITRACHGIKGCVVWTLNMQEYGGFIVDNRGHPKTYAEGNATADWITLSGQRIY